MTDVDNVDILDKDIVKKADIMDDKVDIADKDLKEKTDQILD